MNIINRKLTAALAALLAVSAAADLHAGQQKATPLSDSIRKTTKYPAAATRAAFHKFTQKHGAGWKVRYSPRTGLPEALVGGSTARYRGTPEQMAAAFFADNGELLNVDPLALRLTAKKEFMGITHLQYQQYKDGLPVEFAYARVHVASDGSVIGYQGKFEPGIPSSAATAAVTEAAAEAAASADLGRRLLVSKSELVLYPDPSSGAVKPAWKVRGRAPGGIWVYYIDASSGAVLLKYDDMRHFCSGGTWTTYGSSSGTIYAISPIPTDPNSDTLTEDYWAAPSTAPLRDQYFWVNDYSSVTVTNAYGDYCANGSGARAFSSLKGPYFSVTNFRGMSAHWDNTGVTGTGAWTTLAGAAHSPSPYDNSTSYTYPLTVAYDSANKVFAKVMPHFSASSQAPFQVGAMDIGGTIGNADELYVRNPAWNNGDAAGAYVGVRTSSFYGAAVENPSYTLDLETDGAGTGSGFVADSAYALLFPKADATSNPGLAFWKPGNFGISFMDTDPAIVRANQLAEVNAFYHLNSAHRYFDPINIDPNNSNKPAADLSKRMAVMVHAHGEADTIATVGGMLNGFYDLERDNIMLGDGPLSAGSYRSFALDGTIVRHEYTHSVVNRIYPIVNFGEFGAISEGLADYFSLASLWKEGRTISILGNFIGSGEASARDMASTGGGTAVKVMPTDWQGEVHDDSRMFSESLYDLHFNNTANDGTTSALGTFSSGPWNGQYKADVLTYAALFYFPDSFTNFYDAMVDACKQIDTKWAGACDATNSVPKITAAFVRHGIGPTSSGDSYETGSGSALCQDNNGPECAVDVSSMSALSATVYPVGDVDYYSLTLAAGEFQAKLDLPLHATTPDPSYEAYSIYLFDAARNIATSADGSEAVASPQINLPTEESVCQTTDPCYTYSSSVTLDYTVKTAGRYYLAVAAVPNSYYGNSNGSSQVPYTLTLYRSPSGSASARIYSSSFDNDQISYTVPYQKFAMAYAPSSSTLTSAETVFQYAQLRDQDYAPIALTRTDVSGSYLKENSSARSYSTTDIDGNPLLTGIVQLQPGFAARYPGVGTVYLEIFGLNHMGNLVSLGVSNAINLTSNGAEATAYNNIITSAGGSALIKYAVTAAGTLTVKVYTQTGALVKTVYDGPVAAGKGTYEWSGTNSSGSKAASGIYFVKVKGPGLDKVVKIAVVR